mgnify:CR=1 FL=1
MRFGPPLIESTRRSESGPERSLGSMTCITVSETRYRYRLHGSPMSALVIDPTDHSVGRPEGESSPDRSPEGQDSPKRGLVHESRKGCQEES